MNDSERHTSRDAFILKLLGSFFVAFGLLVLLGLFYEMTTPERWISIGSAFTLIAIGAGTVFLGQSLSRNKSKQ